MFPVILRRGALATSSPIWIVARQITPSVNGWILAMEEGFPAIARISCPATAAAGAPNTGPATNSAPFARISFSVALVTSG